MMLERAVSVMGVEVEYAVVVAGAGLQIDPRRVANDIVSTHPSALAEFGVRSHGSLVDGMLTNGARLYDDAGHPEYSTPECSSPATLVACEKAGERMIWACVEAYAASLPPKWRLTLLKNNTDYFARTWGCHENYLVTPHLFEQLTMLSGPELTSGLVPFLATRQLIAGAGRVGGEGGWIGYQLSQRADFICTLIGLDTTRDRPIVNTRDEPLADRRYFRRLHLVVGDSNMSEFAMYLKAGTTRLVLRMLENCALPFTFELKDPVAAVQAISRNPWEPVELADGRHRTACEIQMEFAETAAKYLARTGADTEDLDVLEHWSETLDLAVNDPSRLGDRLDWAIKLSFLDSIRSAGSPEWNDPLLREIDLRYHDLSPGRGIYHELARNGAVRCFPSIDTEIASRMRDPPADTRANARVEALREQARIEELDWDHLVCAAGRFEWPDPTVSRC
jgi:proteasome accessory factor A